MERHCLYSYLDQTCSFLGALCFWSDKFDKADSLHSKNAEPLQHKNNSDILLHGLNEEEEKVLPHVTKDQVSVSMNETLMNQRIHHKPW